MPWELSLIALDCRSNCRGGGHRACRGSCRDTYGGCHGEFRGSCHGHSTTASAMGTTVVLSVAASWTMETRAPYCGNPGRATVASSKTHGSTVVNRGLPRSLPRHSINTSNNVHAYRGDNRDPAVRVCGSKWAKKGKKEVQSVFP